MAEELKKREETRVANMEEIRIREEAIVARNREDAIVPWNREEAPPIRYSEEAEIIRRERAGEFIHGHTKSLLAVWSIH